MITTLTILMIKSMITMEMTFTGMITDMIMLMIRGLLILGRWSCALPPR